MKAALTTYDRANRKQKARERGWDEMKNHLKADENNAVQLQLGKRTIALLRTGDFFNWGDLPLVDPGDMNGPFDDLDQMMSQRGNQRNRGLT